MGDNTIGLAIGTKRESLGISQQALADAVGLSRPYISQVESGSKKPSDKTLMKIMAVLGMGFPELSSHESDGRVTDEGLAAVNAVMPMLADIGLSADQLNKLLLLAERSSEAQMAVQAYLKSEPMPSGPDGWLDLSKEDRRLVQRIVNRLLKGKEQ